MKPSFYGPVEVRNVVIEGGQRVTGIDLHLHVAGIVSGRVLTGEGKPAKDAVIWVRRPSGDVVERFPTHVDFHGRFAIGGLEPGWNTLAALDGPQRCVEVAVAVEAFVESHVELRLAPATLARLLVRDVPGVTEKVSCRRSDGADFSKWAGGFDSFAPPGEQRIGPLPPGTYTFTVEREPEPPSSQTVIIADEKEVVLVL